MGLFNRKQKEKKIKWFINKKPGDVQLTDKYIKLTINLTKVENIIFYKDIQDIKKGRRCIRIQSKADKYTLSIVSQGEAIIDETYMQLLEKVSEYK